MMPDRKARTAAAGDAVDRIVEDWRRERPELDTSPLQVLARLHRAYILYQLQTARPMTDHGVSLAGFDVLTALRRAGAPYQLTAGELAASGLISSAGVTLRLDRLEKDGLIARERDAGDRRVVRCRLTTSGLTLIDALFEEHLAMEQRLLAGLSPRDRAQLSTLLVKLERSIQEATDAEDTA